jgi:hypothetical protein
MGKRDYRHHESKKQKKITKRTPLSEAVPLPPVVEVVRAPRKGKEEA